ncbi:hypothetical protein [Fodinicola feengrottensis]|uniref:hypothetical protein n=1 Tax=Fodinicola feengrottensis TaxID=435914 RepID=UPI0013CFC6F6|nr:hypothetical protein [Fodinicola feengrottensis]
MDTDGNGNGAQPYKDGDSQRECAWGLKGGHLLLGVQHTTKAEFSPPGAATTVDGIGDQAYFIKANNELHVLHGTLEIVVSFSKDSSPSDDETLIPTQKALASKILEKVGS